MEHLHYGGQGQKAMIWMSYKHPNSKHCVLQIKVYFVENSAALLAG